jgi:hypothetical protein
MLPSRLPVSKPARSKPARSKPARSKPALVQTCPGEACPIQACPGGQRHAEGCRLAPCDPTHNVLRTTRGVFRPCPEREIEFPLLVRRRASNVGYVCAAKVRASNRPMASRPVITSLEPEFRGRDQDPSPLRAPGPDRGGTASHEEERPCRCLKSKPTHTSW